MVVAKRLTAQNVLVAANAKCARERVKRRLTDLMFTCENLKNIVDLQV